MFYMFERSENFPKVTVILRGYTYEQCRCVVAHLVGTHLNAVEVAMNSPEAATIIAQLAHEFEGEVHIGAGTVTNAIRAHEAVEAHASFILSPICFTQEIFDIAHGASIITIPSAFTPTEVHNMFEMGADIVKLFPASRLGAKYLQDIQAPLGWMPLMVVGGVSGDNVQDFFDAGASYAGIGSGIFEKRDIITMNEAALTEQIKSFEKKVTW